MGSRTQGILVLVLPQKIVLVPVHAGFPHFVNTHLGKFPTQIVFAESTLEVPSWTDSTHAFAAKPERIDRDRSKLPEPRT